MRFSETGAFFHTTGLLNIPQKPGGKALQDIRFRVEVIDRGRIWEL